MYSERAPIKNLELSSVPPIISSMNDAIEPLISEEAEENGPDDGYKDARQWICLL